MTLITKETSITALPCSLCAVFMMCFVYKGHAHQLYGFIMTSTAIVCVSAQGHSREWTLYDWLNNLLVFFGKFT